jgi:DNA mismatch repair protein MutS
MNSDNLPPIEHRLTPMMTQYVEIKAANADSLLFYRMGDFYELFFHDAEIASRTLGITLTKRGKHMGEDIPMCGVPVERADDYLQRLIAAGHRVAVCEQLEDPSEAKKRGSKSVVKRDVVRLVTPGTITEDNLLIPSHANVLLALARVKESDAFDETQWDYGLAAVDISTGRFQVTVCSQLHLAAMIARFEPREIVLTRSVFEDDALKNLWREINVPCVPLAQETHDFISSERRVREFYNVASLDVFGQFTRAHINAMALVLFYIERTQKAARPALSPPQKEQQGTTLTLDAATRANLEITRTLSGERHGSLLATIDRTLTAGGGRLLSEWLAAPLTDLQALGARHDALAFYVAKMDACSQVRDTLKALPDLERALGRLALERSGPRDLEAIGRALESAAYLAQSITLNPLTPDVIQTIAQHLHSIDQTLVLRLRATLNDTLPLAKRDGGFIREGASPELDECRVLQSDSRRYIAALQARYATETGCRQLKIKHNHMIGYFVEVPQMNGEAFLQEPWRSVFIHRQTMAGAMRFSTTELSDLETRIASAAGRGLALELHLFDELVRAILVHTDTLKTLAYVLAQLDVITALATLAVEMSWTRPHMDDSLAFHVEGGRHPVVEVALKKSGQPFIANPCDLSAPETSVHAAKGAINLMTGPNMAGKSTYLRQNALIVILAQMGSFVPATKAHIGIVDQVFSRVGAADDLARGRSTFMVEMIETATILHQATHRSLVILDEIGRGTATFDGLSLAWACVEHLHDIIGCRALFATHFHELTALAKRLPRLKNITMKVTDWQGDVVFLHEVMAGAADRSYGIHVAKKAGLPEKVIQRAQTLLHELEKNDRERPTTRVIDDLPLFAVAASPKIVPAAPLHEPPPPDPLREMLKTINPDEFSPRDALNALYALKIKSVNT